MAEVKCIGCGNVHDEPDRFAHPFEAEKPKRAPAKPKAKPARRR